MAARFLVAIFAALGMASCGGSAAPNSSAGRDSDAATLEAATGGSDADGAATLTATDTSDDSTTEAEPQAIPDAASDQETCAQELEASATGVIIWMGLYRSDCPLDPAPPLPPLPAPGTCAGINIDGGAKWCSKFAWAFYCNGTSMPSVRPAPCTQAVAAAQPSTGIVLCCGG
jgi:hypothetical protein